MKNTKNWAVFHLLYNKPTKQWSDCWLTKEDAEHELDQLILRRNPEWSDEKILECVQDQGYSEGRDAWVLWDRDTASENLG